MLIPEFAKNGSVGYELFIADWSGINSNKRRLGGFPKTKQKLALFYANDPLCDLDCFLQRSVLIATCSYS